MSGVVREAVRVFRPRLEVVVRGESGRNELLRGPFALFGVRNSAKLVRDLAKHRRTPMSPSAIDSAYFPGADFCQGRKTQAEVFVAPDMVRSGR